MPQILKGPFPPRQRPASLPPTSQLPEESDGIPLLIVLAASFERLSLVWGCLCSSAVHPPPDRLRVEHSLLSCTSARGTGSRTRPWHLVGLEMGS